MDIFLNKHADKITGVISVFDRIILKGYLPISYPSAAEAFLARQSVLIRDYRDFTKTQTMLLKKHAEAIAAKENRPFEYKPYLKNKDDYARTIAQRDKITEGLVCVISCNEQNHSFGARYGKGRPVLVKNNPPCLTLYYYYLDRYFGLMHVRLSCWLPFNIQVYVNGHEWLARQMEDKDIFFEQWENSFTAIEDCVKAQSIADKLPTLSWEKILHVFARKVNPLLKTILQGMEYNWVIDQAEYATDIMCQRADWLDELYTKWQKHAAVCFQADDIMSFMGRKLHGSFNSTIVTDIKRRPKVTRIKHKVRGNWIKMYNKNGIVLRVETVINRPGEFRVFTFGRGKKAGYWHGMRKRIDNMKRYAVLCMRSNRAYLSALAAVDDPTQVYGELSRICEPVVKADKRIRGFNPLRQDDLRLFEAAVRGEHHLHGFKSNELGKMLGVVYAEDDAERRRQCAKVNRKIRLLRAHGLVTRHGRSRRYRVTDMGNRHMNAAITLHHDEMPSRLKEAA